MKNISLRFLTILFIIFSLIITFSCTTGEKSTIVKKQKLKTSEKTISTTPVMSKTYVDKATSSKKGIFAFLKKDSKSKRTKITYNPVKFFTSSEEGKFSLIVLVSLAGVAVSIGLKLFRA